MELALVASGAKKLLLDIPSNSFGRSDPSSIDVSDDGKGDRPVPSSGVKTPIVSGRAIRVGRRS